uniref:Uncharacterized protein n=1 Tax=Arundo donax TaxID=35708 RepID=A0A0A9FL74_ARUDO
MRWFDHGPADWRIMLGLCCSVFAAPSGRRFCSSMANMACKL